MDTNDHLYQNHYNQGVRKMKRHFPCISVSPARRIKTQKNRELR